MTAFYKNRMYTALMKKKSQRSIPTENGKRLAAFRKAAGLSQLQLAALIGIPQRTLSFYETTAESIPSSIIPQLADELGVTVEDILGISKKSAKRGPKSKLERQFEGVRKLPKSEQEFVSKFLDNVLNRSSAQLGRIGRRESC
jgi:transcriptional regulator with XRE-family HTH domain